MSGPQALIDAALDLLVQNKGVLFPDYLNKCVARIPLQAIVATEQQQGPLSFPLEELLLTAYGLLDDDTRRRNLNNADQSVANGTWTYSLVARDDKTNKFTVRQDRIQLKPDDLLDDNEDSKYQLHTIRNSNQTLTFVHVPVGDLWTAKSQELFEKGVVRLRVAMDGLHRFGDIAKAVFFFPIHFVTHRDRDADKHIRKDLVVGAK